MSMNKQKGNMYGFVTHTWNAIRGVCPHQCSYCYMRRWWPQMKAPQLCDKEFNTNLGSGNTIFVGSSIDMFAFEINSQWICKVLEYCTKFDNTYLFQSKYPASFYGLTFPDKTILCTTVETNRLYRSQMGNTASPKNRLHVFQHDLSAFKKMITIEPIMEFDLDTFVKWMININPIQINIGADSGGNNLPEPSKEKLQEFIHALQEYGLNVYEKPNLKRLLK